MKYRAEIDGLRAVAVLPVIFYHGGFPGFGGGFLGVDVFFVLSGYLITSILCEEHASGQASIAKFYERRARRILPALFLVLAACVPMAWRWLVPADMHEFSQSLLAVLTFVSNIFFWRDSSNYFSTAAEFKPLLHTWSLGVEEQFYIFYPLILSLVWRYRRRWLPTLVIAGALASLAAAQWLVATRPTAAFYLLPSRAWELLLGAFVALRLLGPGQAPSRWLREAGGAIGLAMLATSIIVFRRDLPTPGVMTLIPTAGTALLILFAAPDTFTGRLLGTRPLVLVGLISYSAYLWHQPLFVFARQAMPGKPPPELMLALAGLSLVLAYASWILVESPFRTRAVVGTKAFVRSAIACTVVLAAFASAGVSTGGFRSWQVNSRESRVLATAIPSPLRDACHIRDANRRPLKPCEYFVAPVTWAVLGDSHAVELSFALATALKPRGAGIRHYSRSGCGPAFENGAPPTECRQWTEQSVREILSSPRITSVVLSYRLNLYLTGEHSGLYPGQPAEYTDEDRRRRLTSLSKIATRLMANGKHVTLVLQAPELPKAIENLTLVSGIASNGAVMGASRAWWDERNRYVRAFLPSLPRGITVIDPTDSFCDSNACYAARGGVAFYFDDNHMSVAGASKIASRVIAASASSPARADGQVP